MDLNTFYDAEFDQQDAEVLALDRVISEHRVIEEIPPHQQGDDANAGVQQYAEGKAQSGRPGGNHHAGGVDVEDQGVKNVAGGENDPGLKPAAGPEVARILKITGNR